MRQILYAIFGIILIGLSHHVAQFLFDNFIIVAIIQIMMITCGSWLLGTIGNIWERK